VKFPKPLVSSIVPPVPTAPLKTRLLPEESAPASSGFSWENPFARDAPRSPVQSANRFRGSFHNMEYNVTGSIRVVLHGDSQSVTLTGDSGSASLTLSRR
jgi:hypothetical protein